MSDESGILTAVVVPLVASAVGAGLGAYLAFRNERANKADDQRNADIASARRLLFILSVQFDRLLNFENEVIREYRNFPGAWVVMPGFDMHLSEKLHIDPNDADLLMRLINPELCMSVTIADSAFQSIRLNIKRRAEFVSSKLQPALGKAGIEGVSVNQLKELEETLGTYLSNTAKGITQAVFDGVEGNLEHHEKVLHELHAFLKEFYPEEKFLKVERPEAKPNT